MKKRTMQYSPDDLMMIENTIIFLVNKEGRLASGEMLHQVPFFSTTLTYEWRYLQKYPEREWATTITGEGWTLIYTEKTFLGNIMFCQIDEQIDGAFDSFWVMLKLLQGG
jgi:hypothetical protein